ncbi:MAG: 5,10-methylenetetrahydrofolate reductase [Propionibacteriales bacterium]|nr:5,10-methylenetetrahydrofolate reductase [Propionibacteriales bacterium]
MSGSRTPTTRLRNALADALRSPRYEVLPLPGVDELVAEFVPRRLTVTVTASPRRGLDATLDLTEQLSAAGFEAVPHLAARQVVDASHLAEILARLDRAGVREAFVVAGDLAEPVGPHRDAFALLSMMHRLGHGLDRVGIAGYPAGHPYLSDAQLRRAMSDKAAFATYLVSQLCFDPALVSAWVEDVRGNGVRLPVHVGIAGVVDRRRLLRIATRIGVGESARFLRKHRAPMSHLVLPGGYRPDRLLRGLAPDLATPERRVVGLHVYTFNDLRATESWRRQALARLEDAA